VRGNIEAHSPHTEGKCVEHRDKEHTYADKTTLQDQPALMKYLKFAAADIIPNLSLWDVKIIYSDSRK